jgi:O-antigen/teichoic acid export membrane protein
MAAVSGVLVTLLLLATAPWLARKVLASPDMANLLRIGTLLVLLGAVNAVQTGALAGFEAFKTIAWVNFWSGLISFPCMLSGAYFAGVSGAVWGMVASTAFNAWLCDRALRRHARAAGLEFRLRWADGETALLWNFSLPSLLSSLVGWAGNWGCAAILVNSAGGYGEMGIVNAANQWRQALMFIPGLVINTLLPILANEHRGPKQNFERALNYSHSFLNLIMLPLAALLMLAAKPILLTYGAGFAAGRMALVLVLAGAGISAVSSPIGCVIISTGRMWTSLILWLLNTAAFAGCTWVLAGSCGAAGLGLGLLVGQALQTVVGIWVFRGCLPVSAIRRNLVSVALILLLCVVLNWVG